MMDYGENGFLHSKMWAKMTENERKIKLEKKLIDTGYNRVLQKVKIL